MKTVFFESAHRRKHFAFFNQMNHPHFNLCANVDISRLKAFCVRERVAITPAIVYALSRAANQVREFRWRIRGEVVVEHEVVHPSFTVFTETADVFSFCEVAYSPDAQDFMRRAVARMEVMRTTPSMEDEEGRDDYLFLSAIPWVQFTGLQHAMPYHPTDSVPRLSWGKFFEENGGIKMPLAVQAHHALVDGRQMGQLYDAVGDWMQTLDGL